MRYLTADFILAGYRDPLRNGVLILDDRGMVVDLLDAIPTDYEISDLEHYKGFICPGFVNTHCHLELSWAKGRIPGNLGLDGFLQMLNSIRNNLAENEVQDAIQKSGEAMFHSGVVAVGDIANSPATLEFRQNSPMRFHTFAEVFASDPVKALAAYSRITDLANLFRKGGAGNTVSITPHSTYSVSFELLMLIAADAVNKTGLMSIHHQENPDENTFFQDGTGPVAARRLAYNPGIEAARPTGKRPLESISPFLVRDQKILLVHNTISEEQDIRFAQHYFTRLYWCFCPNANLFIENRLPDMLLFREHGCRITIGTDSLASNHQLSVLEELKTISDRYPIIPLTELISWATKNGAEFLEFDKLGTFEKGKIPGAVLIENVDSEELRLLKNSSSQLLVESGG